MKSRPISAIVKDKTAVILSSNESVADAAIKMKEAREQAALVEEADRSVGILTASDIVDRVVAEGRKPNQTTVAEAMTANPVIIKSHCSVGHALYLMHEYRIRHIPVIDKGKAVGIVSTTDALDVELEEYQHDAKMLDHIAEII